MADTTISDALVTDKLILNKDLYSFDLEKEFRDERKPKQKNNNHVLDMFCNFARHPSLHQILGPINLHYFLNSWGRDLNVNKIVTSEQFKANYWFVLNALYYD